MGTHIICFNAARYMQNHTGRRLHRLGRTASLFVLLCVGCYFPLGCAVTSSGAAQSTQQANQAATSTGLVKSQFFGMVVKSASSQPAVASGTRRLWDAGVSWATLEPARGSFSWSTLDQAVSVAQAAGAEITLTLGMTPAWASSQPGSASPYGAGATAMPANLTDWDTYVAAIAGRYQGRIANYEVWNYPSDAAYWTGAPAQLGSDMATLSAHAAAAIHANDPAARVIAPALDAAGMEQFLTAGGNASVDAFCVALSLAGRAPETMVGEISAVRAAMLNNSAETKPLWNDQPSWTLPASGLSDTDQAAYAARSLVLNASFGLARMAWYAWDENQTSVLRLSDSNGQPTTAAAAYGTMEGWLSGASANGCSSTAAGLWSCQLVRNDQPAWILWSTAGSVQASGMGMATATDLTGVQQAIGASGAVTVGGSPVLLQ